MERLRGPEGETVRVRDGTPSVRTPSLAIREGAMGYLTLTPFNANKVLEYLKEQQNLLESLERMGIRKCPHSLLVAMLSIQFMYQCYLK